MKSKQNDSATKMPESLSTLENLNMISFFSNSPSAMLILDTKGIVIMANQQFEILSGKTAAEITGHPLTDVIHHADYDQINSLLNPRAKEKFTSYGIKIITNTGIHCTEITASYISEPNNNTEFILLSFIDLTEHITRIKELEKSKEQYQNLAEAIDAILWEYSIDIDKWTYVSPMVTLKMGYLPEEWTNMQFWTDHLHPEDREWAVKYCSECTARGEPHTFEYRFQKKTGGYVWIRDVVSVELDEDTPVKLRGFMVDISSQKESMTAIDKFFDQPTSIHLIAEMDSRIKRANRGFYHILGYDPQFLIKMKFMDLVHPDDVQKTIDEMSKLGQGITTFSFENRYRHKDGHWVDLAWSAVFSKEDNLVYAVASDITEKNKNKRELERLLKASQKREYEVSELLNATHAILEKNDFEMVARNIYDACSRVLNARAGYVALLSEDGNYNELLFLDDGKMDCNLDPLHSMPGRGLIAEAYNLGKVVYENDFMNSKWKEFLPEVHMDLPNVLFSPLIIEGKTVGIMGFACKEGGFDDQDARIAKVFGDYAAIALDNSRTFNSLQKSEQEYSKLVNSVQEGIIVVDKTEKVVFSNTAAEQIFEVPNGELIGRCILEFLSDEEKEKVKNESLKRVEGESTVYELRIISGKGNHKILMISANPNYDDNGNFAGTFGIIFDLTSRIMAEENVKKLLKEKEILLREVHHRIKNNMATIESLLRLHIHRLSNIAAKEALQDANNRIKSMRILYEKLYSSDNFSEVNLREYLSPLIDEIMSVFEECNCIWVKREIESFSIRAKLVFPLGIMINEILTNSVKYAFKKTKNPRIEVSAKQNDNLVKLTVKDNGSGFPPDFDINTNKGFGLHLVKILTEQIHGEFKFKNDNGAHFEFIFPLS
jgi:PAS domain S-box-containing protein